MASYYNGIGNMARLSSRMSVSGCKWAYSCSSLPSPAVGQLWLIADDGFSQSDSHEALADLVVPSLMTAMETLWSTGRLNRRLGLPDRGLTAIETLTSSFYKTMTIGRIERYVDKAIKGRQADARIFLMIDSLLRSGARFVPTPGFS